MPQKNTRIKLTSSKPNLQSLLKLKDDEEIRAKKFHDTYRRLLKLSPEDAVRELKEMVLPFYEKANRIDDLETRHLKARFAGEEIPITVSQFLRGDEKYNENDKKRVTDELEQQFSQEIINVLGNITLVMCVQGGGLDALFAPLPPPNVVEYERFEYFDLFERTRNVTIAVINNVRSMHGVVRDTTGALVAGLANNYFNEVPSLEFEGNQKLSREVNIVLKMLSGIDRLCRIDGSRDAFSPIFTKRLERNGPIHMRFFEYLDRLQIENIEDFVLGTA
jgi:hypothetical protein